MTPTRDDGMILFMVVGVLLVLGVLFGWLAFWSHVGWEMWS